MTFALAVIVFLLVPCVLWLALEAEAKISTFGRVLLVVFVPVIFIVAAFFAPVAYTVYFLGGYN